MRSASPRAAAATAALAFLLIIVLVQAAGARRGPFRIDETLKISESAFFGLICQGDFQNAYWSHNIGDRTNPPVGKYAFGAAIALSGSKVPPMPTLDVLSPDAQVPMLYPEPLAAPYLPYLATVRKVSTLCVALIAAILAWLTARTLNLVAAVIALAFFSTNYVTQILWGTAVFDPLFILFATLLMLLAMRPPNAWRWMLAGVLGALAFQTRLNGALFFVITAIVMISRTVRQWKGPVLGAAAFALTALAVNPYYWPAPFTRLGQQFADIQKLLDSLRGFKSLGDKLDFIFQIVFGDLSGLLLLFAAIIGIAWLALRWRASNEELRSCALWSVLTIIVFVTWIPVPFPRYLFAIVPPLCYLAGCGLAGFGEELLRRARTDRSK